MPVSDAKSPSTTRDALTSPPEQATATNTRRAWLMTGLLFAFMLINFADKAILGLVALPLSEEFGLDAAGYGHVASSFYLLFSISAVTIGLLANRIPTRWLLLGLAVIWSLTQVPVVLTSAVGVLVASRIVLGASEGPAYGLANHSLHKWFADEQRQIPSSIVAMGASVGSLAAAPALTWLIVHAGWRQGFVALAIIGIVWCVLWFAVVREEGPYGSARDAQPVPGAPAAPEHRASYLRILASGTFVGSILLGFAAYFGLALSVAWLPRFLEEGRGFSPTAAGNAVAIFWTVGGVITLGAGILSERLTRRGVSTTWSRGMVAVAVVLVGGVATLLGVVVHSPTASLVLLVVGLGAPGAVFALGQTLGSEITPVSQRGAVLGLAVGITTLAGVVAPTVMGDLVESAPTALAGYNHGFEVFAVLCLVASGLGSLMIRPRRDAQRLNAPA